jgi:excisionase family DNA binding protein
MGQTRIDPRRYPIVIRIIDGYIEASQPDLSIYRVRGKFDDVRKAEDIGKIILDVMNEATIKYHALISRHEKIPSPSYPKKSIFFPTEATLSMSEVAKYLGTSHDTVRRLCRDGKLNPTLTRGKHRRFRFNEIQLFRERST